MYIIMHLLTRMIQVCCGTNWGQAKKQMGLFSLLSRPPGPLVPGEVCAVGFHPGLWGPLLRYVVAPSWKDKHQSKWRRRERHVYSRWMSSNHNEVFWRHQRAVCSQSCANHFHGAINRESQFPLLSFNKLSQMVQSSEWREFSEKTTSTMFHLNSHRTGLNCLTILLVRQKYSLHVLWLDLLWGKHAVIRCLCFHGEVFNRCCFTATTWRQSCFEWFNKLWIFKNKIVNNQRVWCSDLSFLRRNCSTSHSDGLFVTYSMHSLCSQC